MNIIEITGQLFGVAGVIILLFCFHNKNMKKILSVKLLADIVWAIHFVLLGAYSGFATSAVACVRECIFMNNDKKMFNSRVWLIAFIIFYLVSGAITWQGAYSIIPAVASSLATYSFWQKNVTVARTFGLIVNVLMFVYGFCVGSYPTMANELLSFVSIIIALTRRNHS